MIFVVICMRILIIEDEFNLADAIKGVLESKKYIVDISCDGEDGLDSALSNIYDLIILDVMLPKMSGFQILKEIRQEEITSKVIMLTAKSTIDDKMEGFNNGADDYLTKPFHMDELLARVNNLVRRNGVKSNKLILGNIELDIEKLNVTNTLTGDRVDVIGKEFTLLEIFLNNPNQIMDKDRLFEKVWGYDSESELNTLEAYISFLRKKLKIVNANVKIKAIRNMGYKLEVDDEKIKK